MRKRRPIVLCELDKARRLDAITGWAAGQAATLLSQARAESGAPEGAGVRFFAHAATETGTEIGLDFVPQPAEGDQVSKQEGVPVYVAPEVAEPLKEAVVDA